MPVNDTTKQTDLIEYKFGEVFKRLDRIEGKVDGFAFVKQSDYDAFKKDVEDNYVKKESLRWIQYVVAGIAVGVGIAVVIGVLKVIGAKL